MNTQEIADRLVAHCRKGDFEAAQKELYADHAVSIEQEASPVFAKETKGLKAIMEKGQKFGAMVQEMHAIEISEPMVAGDSFACKLRMDASMKGRGRVNMEEICLYETENGKIVSESFHN
jgi:hypothetical protein